MIAGLDSAFPPSLAQARAARLTGVQLWSGYISTAPYDGNSHFGLYHPWPQSGFAVARACGSTPIAFCSGWDSPGALKALAVAWDVRLCLDIEGGIRADGPWKQAWLDASGAGVYGNAPCHNCRAAFHVLAAYPGSGDVRATWWSATSRPPGPSGWQWTGSHPEFGITVDRGDYDDWFHNGGTDMTPEEHDWLRTLHDSWLTRSGKPDGSPDQTLLDTWVTARAQIADIQKKVAAGGASGVDLGPLTAQVTALQATLTKIENALKSA